MVPTASSAAHQPLGAGVVAGVPCHRLSDLSDGCTMEHEDHYCLLSAAHVPQTQCPPAAGATPSSAASGTGTSDQCDSPFELLGDMAPECIESLDLTASRIFNFFADCHKSALCQKAVLRPAPSGRSSIDSQLSESSPDVAVRFSVAQYNLLADYLGSNTEPWFLYGVQGLNGPRAHIRKEMLRRLYAKDASGRYEYKKWPHIAKGLLSAAELATVESLNRAWFVWEKRKGRIMQQIKSMSADIVSLVELDHYEDWAKPLMAQDGYDSIFHKRPRSASRDGCGIFWRRSKFELVATIATDFVDSFTESEQGERVPLRDRCALLALLKFRECEGACDWFNGHILVVSTHLARNPESAAQDTLRAKQVGQLLGTLTRFEHDHPEMAGAPIVLAGDMNATNFERLWATAGALAMDLAGNLEKEADTRFGNDRMYQMLIGWSDVPTGLTSITTERTVRIDALMYKPKQLEVVRVMPQPIVVGPIPDGDHPSDHLPICATFRVRKPDEFGIRRRSSLGDALLLLDLRGAQARAYDNTRPAGAVDGDLQVVTASDELDVVPANKFRQGNKRSMPLVIDGHSSIC